MKRVIALICAACIFLGLSPSVALGNDESFLREYTTASDFLGKLGIIANTDSIAKKGVGDNITRVEFGILAYRAFNGTLPHNGQSYFKDISADSSAFTAVNALAQIGIVQGDGGNFEPNGEILLYDAVAIMLRLMGYQNFRNRDNSVFAVETCAEYNLLSHSDLARNTSEKGTLLRIYYILLSKNILKIDTISGSGTEVRGGYKSEADTILSCYFDVYKIKGILNSDGIVNITGGGVRRKQIIVGDFSVEIGEAVNISAGTKVTAYYKDTQNPRLFTIYEDIKNISEFLPIDNNVTFADYNYEYTVGTSTRRIAVDPAKATFIYNNTLLTSADKEFLLPAYGSITFLDNNGDGDFEVINIKSYISFLVKWASREGDEVIISGNETASIFIGDNEACIIKDSKGNISAAEDISAGIVASCAVIEKNGEKYAKEVILSDKRVTGAIEETANEDGKIESVVIGGARYGVYLLYPKLQTPLYPTNESASFYLDFLGNIIDVSYSATLGDVAVGYVVNIGELSKSLDIKIVLYVCDELGRLREYVCADKVMIDGNIVKNDVLALLTTKNVKDEIILFKVNKNDEVYYIDTATAYSNNIQTGGDDRLIKGANDNNENSGRGLYYRKTNKSFGGCVNLPDNGMVFFIPQSPQTASEDEFSIISINDLLDAEYYPVQGYSTDPDSAYSNVVVVKNTGKGIGQKGIAVVKCIGDTINAKGELTYSLHLYDSAGAHVYTAKTKAVVDAVYRDYTSVDKTKYKIEAGDLVRYTVDASNEVTQIVLTYDKSEDTVRTGLNLIGSYTYGVRTVAAIPYSINDEYIKFTDAAKTDLTALTANDFEYFAMQRISKVFNVFKSRGSYNVTEILPSQIKTYKTNGNNYSKAVINTINQGNTIVVIYDEEVY